MSGQAQVQPEDPYDKKVISHNISAPRLCGADFKTPGRCFIFEDTPKSWQVAETHCRQKLPFPGHLGFVKDQETQSLLETEVQKKGWSDTWISGKVSDRRWSWFTCKYNKSPHPQTNRLGD